MYRFQNPAKNVLRQNERINQEERVDPIREQENAQDAGEGRPQEDCCATGLEKKPVHTDAGQRLLGGPELRASMSSGRSDLRVFTRCQKAHMVGSQRLHPNQQHFILKYKSTINRRLKKQVKMPSQNGYHQ